MTYPTLREALEAAVKEGATGVITDGWDKHTMRILRPYKSTPKNRSAEFCYIRLNKQWQVEKTEWVKAPGWSPYTTQKISDLEAMKGNKDE